MPYKVAFFYAKHTKQFLHIRKIARLVLYKNYKVSKIYIFDRIGILEYNYYNKYMGV